mgnify:FL=1
MNTSSFDHARTIPRWLSVHDSCQCQVGRCGREGVFQHGELVSEVLVGLLLLIRAKRRLLPLVGEFTIACTSLLDTHS